MNNRTINTNGNANEIVEENANSNTNGKAKKNEWTEGKWVNGNFNWINCEFEAGAGKLKTGKEKSRICKLKTLKNETELKVRKVK